MYHSWAIYDGSCSRLHCVSSPDGLRSPWIPKRKMRTDWPVNTSSSGVNGTRDMNRSSWYLWEGTSYGTRESVTKRTARSPKCPAEEVPRCGTRELRFSGVLSRVVSARFRLLTGQGTTRTQTETKVDGLTWGRTTKSPGRDGGPPRPSRTDRNQNDHEIPSSNNRRNSRKFTPTCGNVWKPWTSLWSQKVTTRGFPNDTFTKTRDYNDSSSTTGRDRDDVHRLTDTRPRVHPTWGVGGVCRPVVPHPGRLLTYPKFPLLSNCKNLQRKT